MSGVFAAAGAALSPSVRTAATREVADALDNAGINNDIARGIDAPHDGGSVGAMRINDASLDDLTLAGGRVADTAIKAGGYDATDSRNGVAITQYTNCCSGIGRK
jgi:hypothetical protein